VPFVLYNVPAVDSAIDEHFTINALLKHFGESVITVDESSHLNLFTYYKSNNLKQYLKTDRTWRPPQKPVQMRFDDFLYLCDKAEHKEAANRNDTLQYFTIAAGEVIL